jgi:phage shock protein A
MPLYESQLAAMELPELLQTAKEWDATRMIVTELVCRLEDMQEVNKVSEKELADLETKHEAELAELEQQNHKLETQLQALEAKYAKAQRLLEAHEGENNVN